MMRQVLSSSTVASRPERKAGLREGRWYTRSSGATDLRAAHSSSRRPPPSSAGAAKPAVHGEHPVGQPGEGEHLGEEGHPAASDGAELALHAVGVLLGDDQNLGPPVPGGHGLQQGAGLSRPRPAQQQLEYVSPPILWSDIKLYHIPPRRAILDGGDFPR